MNFTFEGKKYYIEDYQADDQSVWVQELITEDGSVVEVEDHSELQECAEHAVYMHRARG